MKNSLIGDNTSQRDIVELRLSWAISMAWQTLLNNTVVTESCFLKSIPYLCEQASEILPQPVISALKGFGNNLDQSVLVLRNCPIDRFLPPTPYAGRLSPSQSPISCLVNLALYQLLGIQPIVYEGENDGNLFRHVVPARAATLTKSSHGSYTRFGYHVDNPDLPLIPEPLDGLSACPEYLSLFGMRCDPRVETTLVVTQQVLERLSPQVIHVLASPRFTISRPASFGTVKVTSALPLIVRSQYGKWLCRFDTENTQAEDEESAAALDALRVVLNRRDLDVGLLLLPGDFLVFKNQQVMHARDSFVPLHDGVDRWLIRLFGISDSTRVLPAMTGRPFEVAA